MDMRGILILGLVVIVIATEAICFSIYYIGRELREIKELLEETRKEQKNETNWCRCTFGQIYLEQR